MATEVIHEHHNAESSGNMGFLLGIILLITFLFLFFYYLLPAIRSVSTPQINIPGQIDVNVKQGGE